jgi:parallel beta-helix repeat protein
MKTKSAVRIAVLFLTLNHPLSTAFAQGSLTPPGPPAPVMKSLDQIEPRIPITAAPYTITNPGSYYLTTNLTAGSSQNGITIQSGGVTVDLNGFALVGQPNSFSGIYVSGSWTNITIRNGSTTGWGASGVDAYSYGPPVNLLFERLTCSGNAHYGIGAGLNSVVRHCVCQNDGWGGISTGGGALVSQCVLNNNTNAYASGLSLSGDCVVRDCQLGFNYSGIFVYGGHCDVHDSQINSNMSDGIYITYNSTAGVTACASSLSGCSLIGNGQNGINMLGGYSNLTGSPATVTGCLVVGNGQSGVYLNQCPASKVSNCNVTGNGLSGIYIGGDGSSVVGNNCQANNSGSNTNHAGVLIHANSCLVEENHLTGNGYAGMAITFGNNSIVLKNTFTDGYAFFGSNDIGPIGTAASSTSPWANIRF